MIKNNTILHHIDLSGYCLSDAHLMLSPVSLGYDSVDGFYDILISGGNNTRSVIQVTLCFIDVQITLTTVMFLYHSLQIYETP